MSLSNFDPNLAVHDLVQDLKWDPALRKRFETTEAEVLDHLASDFGAAEILAGGTDLVGLMKKMIVTPERVVNIMEISSLKRIDRTPDGGVKIGAAVTLDALLESPLVAPYPAIQQAISSFGSMQLTCQGTIGGDAGRTGTRDDRHLPGRDLTPPESLM